MGGIHNEGTEVTERYARVPQQRPDNKRSLRTGISAPVALGLLPGSGFTSQEAAFLDLRHQLVIVDGQAVVLTRQEYRLLAMLAQHSGEILSRAILLTHVFGYPPQARTRTLEAHIGQLRKKLGREGPRIETVVGKGYRFLPLYNPGDQERPTLSDSR